MKLNEKMEELLKNAHIDFTSFTLVEAVPTNGGPVVLLAPKPGSCALPYFNLQYNSASHYYCSMEAMLDSCVDSTLLTRKQADKILHDYNKNN